MPFMKIPESPPPSTASEIQQTTLRGDSNNPESVVPIVRLDVDAVSDVLAGGLAAALVGHVLFLKGQVPLPVMQLARMVGKNVDGKPCGKSPGTHKISRAVKSRTELLASFDTLASHLCTTFTALSTAFAKAVEEGEGEQKIPRTRAYLAILVGPSLGTAKAKVVFAVDGLEVRVWGEREDVEDKEEEEEREESEENEEEEGEEEGEESEEDEEDENEEDEEDENETGENDEATPPPSSPSPSPPSSPLPAPTPLKPYMTHAQQQQTLFNAERLLSRTLADADAHGYGLNSDMAPTQTHILIRAPRRFSHPAWVPRQNVTGMMESALEEFLEESGVVRKDDGVRKKKNKKRGVEGVWVVGRVEGAIEAEVDEFVLNDEKDEMIWWSWEGKLIGFSDW